MAPAQKKWGKEDDVKLAKLFRNGIRKGGVDPNDLAAKTIHQVLTKHFPSRNYGSFAPLFRAKARAWNIDQTLSGKRSKFMPCTTMRIATDSI